MTRGRGGRLAAHAGRVDGFGWDQIQVLVVWDLVEAITIFQELDVQILVDLLAGEKNDTDILSGSSSCRSSQLHNQLPTVTDWKKNQQTV